MWLWFATALAAAPPGLDLDDPTPWSEAAQQLFDGPAGCWEVVGKATWNHEAGRFGHTRGSVVFAGRLEDHVWSPLVIEPLGEVLQDGPRDTEHRVYKHEQRFEPLLGKHRHDRDEDEQGKGDEPSDKAPQNVVQAVLEHLQGNATYAWVEWDDDQQAVVLTETVPVGKRPKAPEIQVVVRFPGGKKLPERADLKFPDRFLANRMPPAYVLGGQVQLRGVVRDGRVFPSAEAYSAELRALGFAFHSAQTIHYTSLRPCPAEGPS